ncbi:MAG: glycosyltransferase family 4 protein [Candidatus Woesearchaeota archaeon]
MVANLYPEKQTFNSGGAAHPYYLSRELAKLGCDIHVFCVGDKNYKKIEYLEGGRLVIHRIKSGSTLGIRDVVIKKYMSDFIFDNKIIELITNENSKEKFDIIHSHGGITGGVFIAKYFNNVKWINTLHSLEKNRIKFMSKEQKKYHQISRWVESTVRYADALITVSNRIKLELIQSYPVKLEKIHYIPNGVDLEVFNEGQEFSDDKRILYVGRFSAEKGIDFIPKIAREILRKNHEIKFEAVAPDKNQVIPPSLEKIKREFEEMEKQYPDRFIWHREPLSRPEIVKVFKKCLLYIQPSRYEAFGLTVLEAMACGKAVIVSNNGGLPEVVENAGVVIPLKTNLFVKEILKLVEDFKLRERYARRAIERVKEFSWEDIAKRTLALYKKVSGQEDKRKGIKEENKIEIEPKAKLKNTNILNSIW